MLPRWQILRFGLNVRHSAVVKGHLRPSRPPSLPLSLQCRYQSNARVGLARKGPPEPGTSRNESIRDAFRKRDTYSEQEVDSLLGTAYIAPHRRYPTPEAAEKSLRLARRMARVRLGHEFIARWYANAKNNQICRNGDIIFNMLKRVTKTREESLYMHAMRIVLPKNWDFELETSKNMTFFESQSGLVKKLRISRDWDQPHTIVIRGQGQVLARAADGLVAACKDVRVYKLGEITFFDYATQQLWPPIEGVQEGGTVMPRQLSACLWAHREPKDYWIEHAYEETPRPKEWTDDSFHTYVSTLIYGRLRPDLVLSIYGQNKIDTDGVRVRMIEEALEDRSARRCFSTPLLKMTLQFMSRRGGHRAGAERLLKNAELWGMPLDTDVYNILLKNYVANRDVRRFQLMLVKMFERRFYPNANTWLHFFDLVQSDDLRRQIKAAMFDFNFMRSDGIRCHIGIKMARSLAYEAFLAGETLGDFLERQIRRFGPEWLTVECANAVLREFFLFHQSRDKSNQYDDYPIVVERLSQYGQKLDVSTADLILEHCSESHVLDWKTALWVLDRMETTGREALERGPNVPSRKTYQYIIKLAMQSHCYEALCTAVFYAIKYRLMVDVSRKVIVTTLLGFNTDEFWLSNRLLLMTAEMANRLRVRPVRLKHMALSGVEHAILTETEGYQPAKPLGEALREALNRDRPNAVPSVSLSSSFPPSPFPASSTSTADETGLSQRGSRPVSIPLVSSEDDGKDPRTVVLNKPFDVHTMTRHDRSLAKNAAEKKDASPAEPDKVVQDESQVKDPQVVGDGESQAEAPPVPAESDGESKTSENHKRSVRRRLPQPPLERSDEDYEAAVKAGHYSESEDNYDDDQEFCPPEEAASDQGDVGADASDPGHAATSSSRGPARRARVTAARKVLHDKFWPPAMVRRPMVSRGVGGPRDDAFGSESAPSASGGKRGSDFWAGMALKAGGPGRGKRAPTSRNRASGEDDDDEFYKAVSSKIVDRGGGGGGGGGGGVGGSSAAESRGRRAAALGAKARVNPRAKKANNVKDDFYMAIKSKIIGYGSDKGASSPAESKNDGGGGGDGGGDANGGGADGKGSGEQASSKDQEDHPLVKYVNSLR